MDYAEKYIFSCKHLYVLSGLLQFCIRNLCFVGFRQDLGGKTNGPCITGLFVSLGKNSLLPFPKIRDKRRDTLKNCCIHIFDMLIYYNSLIVSKLG